MAAFTIPAPQRPTRSPVGKLFGFISDFRNFASILPEDKVQDFSHSANECTFTIRGITKMTVKLAEKHPFHTIVFTSEGLGRFNFLLRVNFTGDAGSTGECQVTMEGDLNPFILKMAEKPLEALVNTMCEKLSQLELS